MIADDVQQYHPGYFGKVGMRYFHKQQNHFWKPIINLDKVHTSPERSSPGLSAAADHTT